MGLQMTQLCLGGTRLFAVMELCEDATEALQGCLQLRLALRGGDGAPGAPEFLPGLRLVPQGLLPAELALHLDEIEPEHALLQRLLLPAQGPQRRCR